jgi:TRAP-type uncharacterized transport system substrate-binding protein
MAVRIGTSKIQTKYAREAGRFAQATKHTSIYAHLNYQTIFSSIENLCLLKNDNCCMHGSSNFVILKCAEP